MQILFQISPAVVKEREEYVKSELCSLVPGLSLSFSPDGTAMIVTLPPDADAPSAGDAIDRRMGELGYRAEPKGTRGDYVPLHTEQFFGKQTRPSRTVSMRTLIISLVVAVLVCSILMFSLGASFMQARQNANPLGSIEGTGENYFDEIALIDQIFDAYSLYDINGDLLLDEMLRGYAAASGDAYAAYYNAEELAALLDQSNSQAVGMGVTIRTNEDPFGFLILDVYDNSPAAKAGVLPGDVIVAVGEGKELVSDIGFLAAQAKLAGTAGTTLHFRVLRGSEEIDFSVVSAAFVAQTVRYRVSETDKTVGIVSIRAFHTDTPVAFYAAMDALIGAGCTSFIYDVRDNPGGDVKSVMAVLSTFLQKGDLVYSTVTKNGTKQEYYLETAEYTDDYASCSIKEEQIGKYRNYKKVILTDGGSASAAELFTAVLLDYGQASAVGTKTFGKGILQTIVMLERWGYDGAIKLTTGYYNPPKSANYHDVGITPTVTVERDASLGNKHVWLLEESEDNQLQAALSHVKQ